MKYLITGLGNMGTEYVATRHNVGFEIVDMLAKEFNCTFKNEMLGDLCNFKYRSREVYLLKPSTFMNRSGKSVRYWMQKLKIRQEHLLIIVDDFQFPYGMVKLHKKGGAGGHNGLKSVEAYLQTSQYARLRVGIGHEFNRGRQVDYVLGKWSQKELGDLPIVVSRAAEIAKSFVAIGIQHTMNAFNQKQDLVKSNKPDQ